MARQPRFTGGSFSLTLERYVTETDEYLEITVEGSCTAGTPAKIYGPPENCYPADPGNLDITAAYYLDENDKRVKVELTDEEEEEVDERGREQAREDWEDGYAEHLYERYRDSDSYGY